MNYVIVLIQAANPAWEEYFLLLPHDWDNGGGHKPLNSAADELRACPVIPSARDREVRGLLAAEPAFAFAGTRSQSVTVRSGGYEPLSYQYGGWTVAAVRKTKNLLCSNTQRKKKSGLSDM